MCLVLVDIRTCFWMELPSGPPERGGQLPDRVHRVSEQQVSGRGAAPGQCELDRVHQEKHNCESTETHKRRFYSWMFEFWKMCCCFFFLLFQILTIFFRRAWLLGPLLMARPDHRICSVWFVKPPWFSKNLWRPWQAPYAPTERESRYCRSSARRSPSAVEGTGLLIFDTSGADTFALFLSHSWSWEK